MKTEINNENKARFFALYWGQEIGHGLNGDSDRLNNRLWKAQSAFTETIELKPLSQISDEDAVEVSGFDSSINWNNGLEKQIWKNTFGFTVVSNGTGLIQKYGQFVIWERNLSHVQFDYLRSKGYALPWMGLSVEEMIEAGWIKLTE